MRDAAQFLRWARALPRETLLEPPQVLGETHGRALRQAQCFERDRTRLLAPLFLDSFRRSLGGREVQAQTTQDRYTGPPTSVREAPHSEQRHGGPLRYLRHLVVFASS